jgi:hypothetical protein
MPTQSCIQGMSHYMRDLDIQIHYKEKDNFELQHVW